MLKKMLALAMAAGVLGVVGMPAVASADWKHKDEIIQENITYTIGAFSATGNVRFFGTLGGFECEVTSNVLLEPGTTGTIKTFQPDPASGGTDTSRCKGLGGLAFCQVHNLTPQVPNWQFHTATWQTKQKGTLQGGTHPTIGGTAHNEAVAVTIQSVHGQPTGAFCPDVTTVSLTAGTVGIIPTTPITEAQLNGILQVHYTTGSGGTDSEDVIVSGTGQVEAPNSGTYSI